ncbi:type II secretion system inner membrane protein GspF [PVC group bacterium]|nr:type II secretion system inner membrane protein GspF [PVC group bacterium]
MPNFEYTAINSQGKEQTGIIDAADPASAINKVRDLGLFPTDVRIEKKAGKEKKGFNLNITLFEPTRVKAKEITVFSRQLATLIDAGLPLLRSLNILHDQLKPGALKNALKSVAEDVESGSTFSEALGKFPKAFDKLYISITKVGEVGGVLDVVLNRLADFSEKNARLKSRVAAAMIYPAVVIVMSIGVIAVLMTFVIPKFKEVFRDMGEALPGPTLFLMNVSDAFREKWHLMIVGVVGLIVGFKYLRKIEKVQFYFDHIQLKLPIVGPLVQKVAIANFTRTLGTMIGSGVPILQSLSIVKDAIANSVIANAIESVRSSIREGESIAAPLGQCNVFPPMVVSMIDVGEETGVLDQMLFKIADNYDEEVDVAVGALTSLMEPILIVVMAVIVGFIVIAMFMPLIALMGSLTG